MLFRSGERAWEGGGKVEGGRDQSSVKGHRNVRCGKERKKTYLLARFFVPHQLYCPFPAPLMYPRL